ncbi:unnamed protein product, partial [Sphenostylis stenocarpa]
EFFNLEALFEHVFTKSFGYSPKMEPPSRANHKDPTSTIINLAPAPLSHPVFGQTSLPQALAVPVDLRANHRALRKPPPIALTEAT